MLLKYLTLLLELRWADFLDIGIATTILAVAIHVLRSSRTRAATIGLLFFGGIFFAATQLELKLTVWMLQGIAAVILLVVIIVYQLEIRRFLEQYPNKILLHKRQKKDFHSGLAEVLADTVKQLAAAGNGALIILPGRNSLEGITTGGVPLNGELSKPLLLSIFDPNSPGHDGALTIRGDKVEKFGIRLPLSDQIAQLRERGTRHAAALGLSEQSEALVLVVSEESSTVSIAEKGVLRALSDLGQLAGVIDDFLRKMTGEKTADEKKKNWFAWYSFETVSALLVAIVLWLVLVPGAVVGELRYEIPIEVQNIPEGFVLSDVSPAKVSVTLSGERRKLFLLKAQELEIRLDATLTSFGRKTFPITPAHLLLPPEISIVRIDPEDVRISVIKAQ